MRASRKTSKLAHASDHLKDAANIRSQIKVENKSFGGAQTQLGSSLLGPSSVEANDYARRQLHFLEQRIASESSLNILRFLTQNLTAEELWEGERGSSLVKFTPGVGGSSEKSTTLGDNVPTNGFMHVPSHAWLWFDELSVWQRLGCLEVRSSRWSVFIDRVLSHPIVSQCYAELHEAQVQLNKLLDRGSPSDESTSSRFVVRPFLKSQEETEVSSIVNAGEKLAIAERKLDSLIVCALLPESNEGGSFNLPDSITDTLMLPFTVKQPTEGSIRSKRISPPRSILPYLSFSRNSQKRADQPMASNHNSIHTCINDRITLGFDPASVAQLQAPQLVSLIGSSMSLSRSQPVAFTDPRSYSKIGSKSSEAKNLDDSGVVKAGYVFHALSLPHLIATAVVDSFLKVYNICNQRTKMSTLPFIVPHTNTCSEGMSSDFSFDTNESNQEDIGEPQTYDKQAAELLPSFLRTTIKGSAAYQLLTSELADKLVHEVKASVQAANKALKSHNSQATNLVKASSEKHAAHPPGVAYFEKVFQLTKPIVITSLSRVPIKDGDLKSVKLEILCPSPFFSRSVPELSLSCPFSRLDIIAATLNALCKEVSQSQPTPANCYEDRKRSLSHIFEAALIAKTAFELDQNEQKLGHTNGGHESKTDDSPEEQSYLQLQIRSLTSFELRRVLVLPQDEAIDNENELPLITQNIIALSNCVAFALASVWCIPVSAVISANLTLASNHNPPVRCIGNSFLRDQIAITSVIKDSELGWNIDGSLQERIDLTDNTESDSDVDLEAFLAEDDNERMQSRKSRAAQKVQAKAKAKQKSQHLLNQRKKAEKLQELQADKERERGKEKQRQKQKERQARKQAAKNASDTLLTESDVDVLKDEIPTSHIVEEVSGVSVISECSYGEEQPCQEIVNDRHSPISFVSNGGSEHDVHAEDYSINGKGNDTLGSSICLKDCDQKISSQNALKTHLGDELDETKHILQEKKKKKSDGEQKGSLHTQNPSPSNDLLFLLPSNGMSNALSLWAEHHFTEQLTEGPTNYPALQIPLEVELGSDVIDFVSAMESLARLRQPWKHAVINAARTAVASLWPEARVEVFGSFATGLGAPSSDVDLVVCDKHHYMLSNRMLTLHAVGTPKTPTTMKNEYLLEPSAKVTKDSSGAGLRQNGNIGFASPDKIEGKEGAESLTKDSQEKSQALADKGSKGEKADRAEKARADQKIHKLVAEEARARAKALASHMQRQSWAQSVLCLDKTLVPVVKVAAQFKEAGAQIQLDFSFDAPSHRGLSTCALVRGLVAQSPLLHPLTLTLREFLSKRGLNDPFSGGLASYGLVLMITHLLHMRKEAVKTASALLKALTWQGDSAKSTMDLKSSSVSATTDFAEQVSLSTSIYNHVKQLSNMWFVQMSSLHLNQDELLSTYAKVPDETVMYSSKDSPMQGAKVVCTQAAKGELPTYGYGSDIDLSEGEDEGYANDPIRTSDSASNSSTAAAAASGSQAWRTLLDLEPLKTSYSSMKLLQASVQSNRANSIDSGVCDKQEEKGCREMSEQQYSSFLNNSDSLLHPIATYYRQVSRNSNQSLLNNLSTNEQFQEHNTPFKIPSKSEISGALLLLRRSLGAGLVGSLLLDFLTTYGEDFSPAQQVIDIKVDKFVPNSNPDFIGQPLVIVDPFDPSNNVGRSCFGIQVLQAVLRQSYSSVIKTASTSHFSDSGTPAERSSVLSAYENRGLVPKSILEGKVLATDFSTFLSGLFHIFEGEQIRQLNRINTSEQSKSVASHIPSPEPQVVPAIEPSKVFTSNSNIRDAIGKYLAPYFFYRSMRQMSTITNVSADAFFDIGKSRPYIFDLIPVTSILSAGRAASAASKLTISQSILSKSTSPPVSLLGSLFDAGHHRSVTQYALSLYLPPNPTNSLPEESIVHPLKAIGLEARKKIDAKVDEIGRAVGDSQNSLSPAIVSRRPVPPPPPRRPFATNNRDPTFTNDQQQSPDALRKAPQVPIRKSVKFPQMESFLDSEESHVCQNDVGELKHEAGFTGDKEVKRDLSLQVEETLISKLLKMSCLKFNSYLGLCKKELIKTLQPLTRAVRIIMQDTSALQALCALDLIASNPVLRLSNVKAYEDSFERDSPGGLKSDGFSSDYVNDLSVDAKDLSIHIESISLELLKIEGAILSGDVSLSRNISDQVVLDFAAFHEQMSKAFKSAGNHCFKAFEFLGFNLRFWSLCDWSSTPSLSHKRVDTGVVSSTTNSHVALNNAAKNWASTIHSTFDHVCKRLSDNKPPSIAIGEAATKPSSLRNLIDFNIYRSDARSDEEKLPIASTKFIDPVENVFIPKSIDLCNSAKENLKAIVQTLEATLGNLSMLFVLATRSDTLSMKLMNLDTDGCNEGYLSESSLRKLWEDWLFAFAFSLTILVSSTNSAPNIEITERSATHPENSGFISDLALALMDGCGKAVDSALESCTKVGIGKSFLPYSLEESLYPQPNDILGFHVHGGIGTRLEQVLVGISAFLLNNVLRPSLTCELQTIKDKQIPDCLLVRQFGPLSTIAIRLGSILGGLTLRRNRPIRACCFDVVSSLCHCLHLPLFEDILVSKSKPCDNNAVRVGLPIGLASQITFFLTLPSIIALLSTGCKYGGVFMLPNPWTASVCSAAAEMCVRTGAPLTARAALDVLFRQLSKSIVLAHCKPLPRDQYEMIPIHDFYQSNELDESYWSSAIEIPSQLVYSTFYNADINNGQDPRIGSETVLIEREDVRNGTENTNDDKSGGKSQDMLSLTKAKQGLVSTFYSAQIPVGVQSETLIPAPSLPGIISPWKATPSSYMRKLIRKPKI